MGMFKDLKKLTQQGNEMRNNMDVKGQMAQGMAAMQQANAMMAQQTAALQIATTGESAIANITAIRQAGPMINYAQMMEIDLLVMRGGVPIPVTYQEAVPPMYLARLKVGESVRVKVDPSNPTNVWVDWATPV